MNSTQHASLCCHRIAPFLNDESSAARVQAVVLMAGDAETLFIRICVVDTTVLFVAEHNRENTRAHSIESMLGASSHCSATCTDQVQYAAHCMLFVTACDAVNCMLL